MSYSEEESLCAAGSSGAGHKERCQESLGKQNRPRGGGSIVQWFRAQAPERATLDLQSRRAILRKMGNRISS